MINNSTTLFAACFFGGMMLELALLLAFTVKENKVRLLALLLLPPLLYFMGLANSAGGGDYVTVLISACVGVFGITFLFLPEILPVITRYHVLAYTVTFWYALAGAPSYYLSRPFHIFLFLLSLAGAAGALRGQFRLAESGKIVWNLGYAWYLAALAYIGFSQIGGLDMDFFSASAVVSLVRPGPLEALVYGLAFAYVAMSFSMVYIYMTLGYTQAVAEPGSDRNKKQLMFLKNVLASKTQDITLEKPGVILALLGAQFVLGALNLWLNLVPHIFLLNCFVLVVPYLLTRLLNAASARPSPGI